MHHKLAKQEPNRRPFARAAPALLTAPSPPPAPFRAPGATVVLDFHYVDDGSPAMVVAFICPTERSDHSLAR